MTEPFQIALKYTLGVEGDFSDHPSDSGGKTRYGITEHLARAYGYRGSMRELAYGIAESIYERHFWQWLSLDSVAEISEAIACEVFDSAVNVGRERAAEWLQRLLNGLNGRATYWADLNVDGIIGPRTLGALRAYFKHRGQEGEEVFLKGLNALQGAYYVTLAERREKDEVFLFGWLRTRL